MELVVAVEIFSSHASSQLFGPAFVDVVVVVGSVDDDRDLLARVVHVFGRDPRSGRTPNGLRTSFDFGSMPKWSRIQSIFGVDVDVVVLEIIRPDRLKSGLSKTCEEKVSINFLSRTKTVSSYWKCSMSSSQVSWFSPSLKLSNSCTKA